jgi:CheY-like chemotaxis protein
LAGVRVMAVDDEADALGLLRVVLEAAGAEVFTFSSATTALEHIGEQKPDALVVDLGMPGIDGFGFITRLRESPDREIRDIPAAALTAFARSDRTSTAQRFECISRSRSIGRVGRVGRDARQARCKGRWRPRDGNEPQPERQRAGRPR